MDTAKIVEKAEKIKKAAEEIGASNNFLFSTTFERYLDQLEMLAKLQEAIEKDGVTVSKSYVKDVQNLYPNPAVREFNRTVDSANKTAIALLKIIRELDSGADESDPLMDYINGGDPVE